MKKISLIIGVFIFILVISVLQSCNDDDDSINEFQKQVMSTVRVTDGATYYLEVDDKTFAFPRNEDVSHYQAVDGQRVIANISSFREPYEYDGSLTMTIINHLSNVLTKNVEELTATNETTYGNSPLRMKNIWLSPTHLNVEFLINAPSRKKHHISLVRNATVKSPQDGYLHLELRYNNRNDVTRQLVHGFVSFYIGEWGKADELSNSIRGLKIKVNTVETGEKEYVFDYNIEKAQAPSIEDVAENTSLE
jgi:hypothetical protein